MPRVTSSRTIATPESLLLDLFAVAPEPLSEVWLKVLLAEACRTARVANREPVGKVLQRLARRGLVVEEAAGYRAPEADERLRDLLRRSEDFWAVERAMRNWASTSGPAEYRRQLRLAVFRREWQRVLDLSRQVSRAASCSPLDALARQLRGVDWLEDVPPQVQDHLVHGLALHVAVSGVDTGLADWLSRRHSLAARTARLERAVLRGELDEARALARDRKTMPGWCPALLLVAEGRLEEAQQAAHGLPTQVDPGVLAPSLIPMLLLGPHPAEAEAQLRDHPGSTSIRLLHWLTRWRALETDESPPTLGQEDLGWPTLVRALCLYWADHPERTPHLEVLRQAELHCRRSGFTWLADQMEHVRRGRREGLATLLEPAEGWQRILHGLRRLNEPEAPATERLAWELNPALSHAILQPRVQKVAKRGGWTAGRQIEWHQVPHQECATAQDRRAFQALDESWRRQGFGGLAWGEALAALVGHPLLIDGATGESVQLLERRAGLQVVRQNGHVRLSPTVVLRDEDYVLERETPQQYALYRMHEVHRRLARLVGAGVQLPVAVEEELRGLLAGLADRVPVLSDVPIEGQQVEAADPAPCILLFPEGEGLRALVRVRVLGAFMAPGTGALVVAGDKVQAQRNLEEERRLRDALLEACPALAAEIAPSAEAALELLEQLAGRPEEILWPEGGKLQVQRTLDAEALRLRVRSDRDWFRLEGEVEVGPDEILELRRLLEHAHSTGSRFVPLGEGRFLALSAQLRRRLDEVGDLASTRGSALEVHPLAGLALEADGDEGWRDRVAGMRRALAMKPRVPKALQAELRDYQADGYRWLVRTAAWAGGACLADDMGLGKTVQALALLLQRAAEGPALVVAPTSVCPNWAQEAARFAPSLRVVPLETERGLDDLGPGDLVIASYGLLVREAERLAEVEWSTALLDEAQAIKNPATRRFKAAVGLSARLRLATTGTPVENRLDELWALFRFLAPGLLGSREKFAQRFAGPIERAADPSARERLQRLVRPFLLRRTKDQVLRELPSRTEVEILVDPTPKEKALYEALRQEALERIQDGGEESRFHVLAELMRLRRAACHPRLVAPQVEAGSGKHEVFAEVLEELLAEDHRVLVFSQFVDHLALVREHLDARGVSYQYLDGSTPSRERARRVKAFQDGEGEVFLISLRAGGSGLNLTGADYVIHMDPWWNPAVEDQASDRAHRIGQKRPVTIYRLVARGTIEEKILRLHADKRKLAEGLLSGADTPGAVPVEELVRLLREG